MNRISSKVFDEAVVLRGCVWGNRLRKTCFRATLRSLQTAISTLNTFWWIHFFG